MDPVSQLLFELVVTKQSDDESQCHDHQTFPLRFLQCCGDNRGESLDELCSESTPNGSMRIKESPDDCTCWYCMTLILDSPTN